MLGAEGEGEMNQEDAKREIVQKWRALPKEQRQTDKQGAPPPQVSFGTRHAKAQANGGSTHGADQGTRCAVWTVAGENDYAALSHERYVGDYDQPGKNRSRRRVQNYRFVDRYSDGDGV